MSAGSEALAAYLATGCTTLARVWAITRRDGLALGFTDHDRRLVFEGIAFEPSSGMTAQSLMQGTGLSVDNTEAVGALRSDRVTEADLLAGRYDGAEIRCWLVNWQAVEMRALLFRGSFGEVSRSAGAFTVELRGLSAPLEREGGRIYHRRCSAILGDAECGFDLGQAGYRLETEVEDVEDARLFRFADLAGYADRWFEKGRFEVLSGASTGLLGVVKNDRVEGSGARQIELWSRLGAEIAPGDRIRVDAGCDRRAETCRLKFLNFLNFRGFPHIPGDDWLTSYPVPSGANAGGSLFR